MCLPIYFISDIAYCLMTNEQFEFVNHSSSEDGPLTRNLDINLPFPIFVAAVHTR